MPEGMAVRNAFLITFFSIFTAASQTQEKPVRAVTDPGVVTTRQSITPAGVQAVFEGRVYGVAFGQNASEVWVLNAAQVCRFDWKENRVLNRVALEGRPGLQSILYDETEGRVLVGCLRRGADKRDRTEKVRLLSIKNGVAEPVTGAIGSHLAGALALARDRDSQGRRIAVAPLTYDNKLAVIDVTASRLITTVSTGIAPFGAAINHAGTIAYVTNWGGRIPEPDDLTAPTGLASSADRVVINQQGVAATGSVMRVDLAAGNATHTIPVELHPTAIVWDEGRQLVYVANGNTDSISVIDTAQNRVIRTVELQPFRERVSGISPTALALSQGGSRLFVACGGINAVAVVNTRDFRIEGLIPTAWYPNGLSVSIDGKYLAVSTLLGVGSGWQTEPRRRFVHAYRGSISVVAMPDEAQLASYTTAVAENNRMMIGPAEQRRRLAPDNVAPKAIPRRAGEPSFIEHVVYIVKENRTYDQVFGDISRGNGDPSLVMFGEDVTPNQHRLADQFVLLDNFYATGGNSADGHQWVTQANEVDYCLWPGYTGRSYPFDGSDPIAYSAGGFIWDAALRMKKMVRVYGEYAPRIDTVGPKERMLLLERWKKGDDFSRQWQVKSPIPTLDRILARNFPSYCLGIPDVVRAQIFLTDLQRWEREGTMPNLTIMLLPSNHTWGATPGVSSAKAMVADNDLALGQIVEALTKTKFWKKMAIFVVEDDAQNGVDHVDGHRTVALAISPYARRGYVDSTFYSQQSILKTIELVLGLPTLSLFDLIANDMRASFQDTPNYAPYEAVMPKQSLFEKNPELASLRGPARQAALDSMKMRWDVPDAAPSERLNRILWHQVKGWNTPYPRLRRAVFTPLAIDLEDDERE